MRFFFRVLIIVLIMSFQYSFGYERIKLGPEINTELNELIPIMTQDGKRLYFCRSANILNFGRDDIWYSDRDENGKWTKGLNIGQPLNNDLNNFVCGISPTGDTLILGAIYDHGKDSLQGISFTFRNGNEWSYPKSIMITNYYNLNDVNGFYYCFKHKTLLMTIQRNDSYGEKDIYVSFLQDQDKWIFSEPRNLGPTINTKYDELSPFLAFDGVTMYFSSFGHDGFGESDIYMARRIDNTWKNWTIPVNLGRTINTAGWDAHFKTNAEGIVAYYSSTDNVNLPSNIFEIRLDEQFKPLNKKPMIFEVFNFKNFVPIPDATVRIYKGEELFQEYTCDFRGKTSLYLPYETFTIEAAAEGYQIYSTMIDLSSSKVAIVDTLKIGLIAELDTLVNIPNVLFNFAEMKVASTFADLIAELADFLEINDAYKIKLVGHTDHIGSDAVNYQLGLSRAREVASLLVRFGIDNKRIIIESLGKSSPIVPNDTKENRYLNRRVEFHLVLSK